MPAESLAIEIGAYARAKLAAHLSQVLRCVRLLDDDETWHRANGRTNSVGNLVLHLTGNVRQWIVDGIGGEAFVRDRPAEFAQRGPLPTGPMLGTLEQTVRRACEIISGLDANGLAVRRTIQGYDVSTLVAVFHVVEHFSWHAGQIVHLTKAMKDVDVSLYDPQGHRLLGAGRVP